MLQIDRTAGGWILHWNEVQICPLITDVNELISLHYQLTLLLIALDIERQGHGHGRVLTPRAAPSGHPANTRSPDIGT